MWCQFLPGQPSPCPRVVGKLRLRVGMPLLLRSCGMAGPGLDPVLHFCVWQVGSEVLSNLWPVPADWVSRGLPCPAHPKSRNVEEVCRFPELPARKPLTYQAKQLMAREVEVEKMRRVEASARARDGPQVSLPRPWAEQGPRSGHEPCRGPA